MEDQRESRERETALLGRIDEADAARRAAESELAAIRSSRSWAFARLLGGTGKGGRGGGTDAG